MKSEGLGNYVKELDDFVGRGVEWWFSTMGRSTEEVSKCAEGGFVRREGFEFRSVNAQGVCSEWGDGGSTK
jgi:hypothetical protein